MSSSRRRSALAPTRGASPGASTQRRPPDRAAEHPSRNRPSDDRPANPVAPAIGLLLYASYPAGDISGTLTAPALSISGSRDGLATPEKVAASVPDLPVGTRFVQIDGASHAQFGDYGPQPGDNTPRISNDEARTRISQASLLFVENLKP